jgi:hypothetical protein
MAESSKFGFEHSDEKIELEPIEAKIKSKREASDRRIETISEGFEKVEIESMGSEHDPKYEMDLFVIRERVSSKDEAGDSGAIKIYIGKNELEAKTRQAKGYAERQEDDYDQHDWVDVGKDGSITVHDWPDGRDYLSNTARVKGRLKHLASKFAGKL